jgi:hypothetical protein
MGVAVIGLAVRLLRGHEAIPPVTVAIPPPPATVEEAEPPKGSPAEPREERASAPEIAPAGDVEAAAPKALLQKRGATDKQIKKIKKPLKKPAVEEAPTAPKSLKGRFGTEIDLNYNE